jgi:hypothetical protein
MRLLLAVVVGAIAVFVWGAVFWMNPLPALVFQTAPDNAGSQMAIAEHFPASGVYFVPSGEPGSEEFATLHEKGPVAMMFVQHDPGPAMPPKVLAHSFANNIVTVFLLVLLTRMMLPALRTYGSKVFFCTLVMTIGGITIHWGNLIWWRAPLPYTILEIAYIVGSGIIAGLVIGALVKSSTKGRETAEA